MTDTPLTIDYQAAEWFIKNISNSKLQKSTEFYHWLSENSNHAQAYKQMEHLWSELDELKCCNVKDEKVRVSSQKYSNNLFKTIASVTAIVFITITLIYQSDFFEEKTLYSQTFVNSVGELSQYKLPDKSELTVDTDTNLSVAFYDNRREIYLTKGQIVVHTAKDASKPLYVFAGDIRIKVVGTIFEVRKWGYESRVTIEKGKVEVHRYIPKNSEFELLASLSPNQRLSYNHKNNRIERDEISRNCIALWRKGQVMFEKATLSEVLEEFRRYEEHAIHIKDEKVKALTITGTFNLRASDSFLQTLPIALPVKIVHKDGKHIILTQ